MNFGTLAPYVAIAMTCSDCYPEYRISNAKQRNDYSKDIHLTKSERKGKTYEQIQELRKLKRELIDS